MPVFVEDPSFLSISRLRSDLVAHNVKLPPSKSRKEVYVELHRKHINLRQAAEFSSDEEEEGREADEAAENPVDTETPDLSGLTDCALRDALLQHGVKPGPILASTRGVYERKLAGLLRPDNRNNLCNGAEEAMLCSDSEEEEDDSEEDDAKSDEEEQEQEVAEQSMETRQEVSRRFPTFRNREASPKRNVGNASEPSGQIGPCCSQISSEIRKAISVDQRPGLGPGVGARSQSVMAEACSSFQAFSITEMVEEESPGFRSNHPQVFPLAVSDPSHSDKQMESRGSLSPSTPSTARELSGSSVHEHWSRSSWLDQAVPDHSDGKNRSLYHTPGISPRIWGLKPPREPASNTFQDLLPPPKTTPTGIYATCRRPIKGAAGRPVQYLYPNTPVSPTTLERREVQRRLVPIGIQILVFVVLAFILYLIYVSSEEVEYRLSLS